MVLLEIMESHFRTRTKKGVIAKGLYGEDKNHLKERYGKRSRPESEGRVLEFWK